jgi:uncharacterized protein
MIEVAVDSVRTSLMGDQRVVVLKAKEAERYLLIWVGGAEAASIALAIHNTEPPRPLSHDLMLTLVGQLGFKITRVLVNDLVEDTYYARITLKSGDRELELDSRPSDAIALALRAKSPVYVAADVMDRAGIEPASADSEAAEGDRLSVFRAFINTLDLTGLTGEDQDNA